MIKTLRVLTLTLISSMILSACSSLINEHPQYIEPPAICQGFDVCESKFYQELVMDYALKLTATPISHSEFEYELNVFINTNISEDDQWLKFENGRGTDVFYYVNEHTPFYYGISKDVMGYLNIEGFRFQGDISEATQFDTKEGKSISRLLQVFKEVSETLRC